MSICTTLRG